MPKKPLPWLRLYTEFADDHKIQRMPESMQRRFVMLMCLQRSDELNFMSDDDICYRLNISKKQWRETKILFHERGFLNDDDKISNGDDVLKNFALRQRDSDDSAKRKREWRKNKALERLLMADVTGQSQDMSRDCPNADTETDSYSDSDTETDLKHEELTKVNSLSGKPDDSPLSLKNSELKKQAIEILEFLNEKTGKAFRPVDTNLKFIISRLKSGAQVEDCRAVIAKKYREWKGDPVMVDYVRPATLFNATKFEQYFGELNHDA